MAIMKEFLWIPGNGHDQSALKRLRDHFPKPAALMGEAWFMSPERRMFADLLGDVDKFTAFDLQEPLIEIASGTSAFGPLPEWTEWCHYLLATLLPRSHEHFVDDLLEYLITCFMVIHPNGVQRGPIRNFTKML